MLLGAFVTLAAIPAAARPASAALPSTGSPAVVRRLRPTVTADPVPDPAGAYSLRARRRFAAYLRMRLLELREAGLERAARVIERRLPADSLLRP